METKETTTKTKWAIDAAHSEIGFKVKHLMISNVRGTFSEYDASIYTTDEDFLSAEIDFWLNPASVNTNDANRDGHLKGPDFFDVEQFKEINFVANTYETTSDKNKYILHGDLTIKGIKNRIKLDVEYTGIMKDPWGNHKAAFSISGKINRKDWGLNWNAPLETGGLLVSEEVWINCEVQLARVVE
ncbi:MAG TPA: YceI family protein [Bacteroidia bacterium]|nr:YceI family protein [Bacteroidia bacterium]